MMARTTILDFGHHHGEGLRDIVRNHLPPITPNFDVLAFEPVQHGAAWAPPCDFRLVRAAVGPKDGHTEITVNPGGNSLASTIETDNAWFGSGELMRVPVVSPRTIATMIGHDGPLYAKIDIEGTEYRFFEPFVREFGNRILGVWMEPHQENRWGPGGAGLNADWPTWEELILPAVELGIPAQKWH